MKLLNPIIIKLKPVWVVVIGMLFLQVIAGGLKASPPDSLNIFYNLKNIPAAQRIPIAMDVYKKNFRKVNEVAAMHGLDGLAGIAKSLNDKNLENSIFEMRGDYYSVNHGFNPVSTSYYQKAIDFAIANNDVVNIGVYQHKMGIYYFVYKRNTDASKRFLQAQDIFKSVGYDNVPNISVYLNLEASFYYDLGDYDNATIYLKEALKHPIIERRPYINIINTLGLICRNNKQFAQAITYFNQALKVSKSYNDTAWVAITTGNIGSVFFLEGDYEKALPYINTDYTISLKYGEKANASHALLRLIKINLVNGNLKDADQQLITVEELIKAATDGLKLRIEFYGLKAELLERKGSLALAIAYRKSMEQAKDSLQQRNNIAVIERDKLGWEMANHRIMVDKLTAEAEVDALRRNAIIMGLISLIVISALVYNQQLIKIKRDRKVLISEKQQVDESLKNAESELLLYTESLRKKNAVIEYFRKEIARLELQVVNKDEADHLEKLMQAHIMTDENWDEFKHLFGKVHTGFFTSIKKSYPGLSATDTRILTLMKLNLSNREMANMLGITVEGIKKAKQRLRKKMNLAEATDIEQAIAAI